MLKFNFRTDINRAFARTEIDMDVLLLYKFSSLCKINESLAPEVILFIIQGSC